MANKPNLALVRAVQASLSAPFSLKACKKLKAWADTMVLLHPIFPAAHASKTSPVAHAVPVSKPTTWLDAQVLLYKIIPEAYTDIKRLPLCVTDLPLLAAEMVSMSLKQTAGGEDAVESGTTHGFKNLVCILHAIKAYLEDSAIGVRLEWTFGELALSVHTHASTHTPATLSTEATQLWTAVFSAGNFRTQAMIVMVLSLLLTEPPSGPHRTPL
jgi:hypothetical protein